MNDFTSPFGGPASAVVEFLRVLSSDPLALLAILGGLAVVCLNIWFFRLAGGTRERPPAGSGPVAVFPLLLLTLQEEGLTIGEVLESIPTDSASVFVYVLLATSIVLVWKANRTKQS